mgnify:CR=1 FL=1
MNDFENEINDDRFLCKVANFTRKLGKTVLGRNMKRFKPSFLHQNYYSLVNKLIDIGIVTLARIAIDSTLIEVHGSSYQKGTKGRGKKKVALGYRLSVAFDLDSKLPVAYILTFGHEHDSRFLVPLIETIKSRYGLVPERVVMDRGYYGQDYFNYLTENGSEFEIPLKKYGYIKEMFQNHDRGKYKHDKQLKIEYLDDYIDISGYGKLRVIWIVHGNTEDLMPDDLENNEWWGILTNRADLSPVDIILAYKERWEIEVFFRSTKQRMALDKLPGTDFRQVQTHIFFVFVAYILLMLVRHLADFDDNPLRIELKFIQDKALFVKAVFVMKGRRLNVHFTGKGWLYHHEEEISLV